MFDFNRRKRLVARGVCIAEEPNLEFARPRKVERQREVALFVCVEAPDEPLASGAARHNCKRTDLAVDEARLVA